MSLVLLMACLYATTPLETESAKQFFEAGKRAYQAGRYDLAARAFHEALSLVPRAEIVFSAAQAHRLQFFVDRDLVDLEEAIELYARYVRETPRGGRRDDAVRFLAELEPILRDERTKRPARPKARPVEETQILISSPAEDSQVAIDGTPSVELPHLATLTPGPHKLEVSAPGFRSILRETTAVAGKLLAIDVPLAPLPGQVFIETQDDAQLAVDGLVVARTPQAGPIEVEPGRRWIAVFADGRSPYAKEWDLPRGSLTRIPVSLESTVRRDVARYLFWGAGAIAIGAAGFGGTALVADSNARSIQDELERGLNLNEASRAEYESSRETRNFLRAGAAALGGAAILTASLGLILYLTEDSNPPPRPAAPLAVDDSPEMSWDP